jgi:hypothetical protein
MRAIRSFLLAGLFAGALTAATSTAHAARVGISIGFGVPVAPVVNVGYIPACPGPDYYWNAGYYVGRVWYPGRWIYRAPAYGGRAFVEHRDFYRDHAWGRDYRSHEGYRR